MGMNEILFYGGLTAAAASALLAIITAVVLMIRHMHIEAQLDEEYGRKKDLKQKAGTKGE